MHKSPFVVELDGPVPFPSQDLTQRCAGWLLPSWHRTRRVHKPRSSMDPLSCNIWPSRRHSDSARLGRSRYTITGRDHDPVPTSTSGQETWSEPRPEGLAEMGLQSDSDPVPPTEDMADLCSPLFLDRHGRDRLRTTDQDACSVWAQGASGVDKIKRSSQPQC